MSIEQRKKVYVDQEFFTSLYENIKDDQAKQYEEVIDQ